MTRWVRTYGTNHAVKLLLATSVITVLQVTTQAVTLGHWGPWSTCSVTSGVGTRVRSRVGHTSQTEPCQAQQWAPWSSWGACTASVAGTCDHGSQVRVRHCDGGTACVGAIVDEEVCSLPDCKGDGNWSDWTIWSTCNATCGEGHQFKARLCNNPAPAIGGNYCVGDGLELQTCKIKECPIDGGWGNYISRPCTKTCGVGLVVTVRACDSPTPQYGGKQCNGSSVSFSECVLTPCVIDGAWSAWSNYTDCEVVCGEGTRRRTRLCNSPSPRHGGLSCNGSSTETVDCSNGNCPADIRQCDKHKVMDAVFNATSVPSAGGEPCANSSLNRPESLIEAVCGAPSNTTTWELGLEVLTRCEVIPLYVPVGHIDRTTRNKQYGVLVECAEATVQIASQSCTAGVSLMTIRRDDGSADLHMLLW